MKTPHAGDPPAEGEHGTDNDANQVNCQAVAFIARSKASRGTTGGSSYSQSTILVFWESSTLAGISLQNGSRRYWYERLSCLAPPVFSDRRRWVQRLLSSHSGGNCHGRRQRRHDSG
jgi:hypothetical protein